MSHKKLTREVFVAGRYPAITYNPRNARAQEAELNNYLQDQGKALTVSGPSKSGKTVLVEHILPETEAKQPNRGLIGMRSEAT